MAIEMRGNTLYLRAPFGLSAGPGILLGAGYRVYLPAWLPGQAQSCPQRQAAEPGPNRAPRSGGRR